LGGGRWGNHGGVQFGTEFGKAWGPNLGRGRTNVGRRFVKAGDFAIQKGCKRKQRRATVATRDAHHR